MQFSKTIVPVEEHTLPGVLSFKPSQRYVAQIAPGLTTLVVNVQAESESERTCMPKLSYNSTLPMLVTLQGADPLLQSMDVAMLVLMLRVSTEVLFKISARVTEASTVNPVSLAATEHWTPAVTRSTPPSRSTSSGSSPTLTIPRGDPQVPLALNRFDVKAA